MVKVGVQTKGILPEMGIEDGVAIIAQAGYDNREYKIKHFRVDKMADVSVVYEERKGKEEFSKMQMSEYTNRLFGMFDGNLETVTLLCENHAANVIIDRFGTDIPLMKTDAEHFTVRVRVSVSKLFLSWIMAIPT